MMIITAMVIIWKKRKHLLVRIRRCEATNANMPTHTSSIKTKPSLIRFDTIDSILLDTLAADSQMDEELKLSDQRLQYYRNIFIDVLIPFDLLKVDPISIGEGAFGVVYKAMLKRNNSEEVVAVKTIKGLHSASDITSFFEESARMKSFRHPNVVGLIAMCLDSPDGIPRMVLPYMANGNLKKFLQRSRRFSQNTEACPEGLSQEILIKMCLDIARGMNYLADRRFIHRDLAARNCM